METFFGWVQVFFMFLFWLTLDSRKKVVSFQAFLDNGMIRLRWNFVGTMENFLAAAAAAHPSSEMILIFVFRICNSTGTRVDCVGK